MVNLTIRNLDAQLKSKLRVQAARHGRSMEEEAREILRAGLAEPSPAPLNLAAAIQERFTDFADFELPVTPREPMHQPPSFAE